MVEFFAEHFLFIFAGSIKGLVGRLAKKNRDFSNIKTLRVEKHPLQVFRFSGTGSGSDSIGGSMGLGFFSGSTGQVTCLVFTSSSSIFGGLLAEFLGFEALLSNHSFGGSVDSSMKLGVLKKESTRRSMR